MNLPANPLESFRRRNPHLYPAAEQSSAGPAPVKQETANAGPVLEIMPSTDEAKLNKTERARLAWLQTIGVQAIGVQSITLKLGDDCRFTPDFHYITSIGRMVFEDVKGHMRDDALVKIKTAARQFRWATFLIVKKDGSGWEENEIKP